MTTKRLKTPRKPRNPAALALRLRRGGVHAKSNRALRKAANDAVRKQWAGA